MRLTVPHGKSKMIYIVVVCMTLNDLTRIPKGHYIGYVSTVRELPKWTRLYCISLLIKWTCFLFFWFIVVYAVGSILLLLYSKHRRKEA